MAHSLTCQATTCRVPQAHSLDRPATTCRVTRAHSLSRLAHSLSCLATTCCLTPAHSPKRLAPSRRCLAHRFTRVPNRACPAKRDPSSTRCTCARYFFGPSPRSRFTLYTDLRRPFRPHEANPREVTPLAHRFTRVPNRACPAKRDPSSTRCTCARYFFGPSPRSRFTLYTDPRRPFRPHEANPREATPLAHRFTRVPNRACPAKRDPSSMRCTCVRYFFGSSPRSRFTPYTDPRRPFRPHEANPREATPLAHRFTRVPNRACPAKRDPSSMRCT